MTKSQAKASRAFMLENDILIIAPSGVAEKVEFSPMKIGRIVISLSREIKKFPSADCMLKEAILEYTETHAMVKIYKAQAISESSLYTKLRNVLKRRYQEEFEENQERIKAKEARIKEAREKDNFLRNTYIESMMRRKSR